MKELKELSANYATEKTNEMMSQIVAQAFADGYRMGYKDREDEIPVDLRDGKTEFVDLGLPSGTIWSVDYERGDGNIVYMPYNDINSLAIPTKEQWEELKKCCQWKYIPDATNDNLVKAICIGPNGNSIQFVVTGKVEAEYKTEKYQILFWIKESSDKINCARIRRYLSAIQSFNGKDFKTYDVDIRASSEFTGYKLPIRLVKAK